MAEELNLIENTDLIQLKQDIIDLKGELSDNQSLIFYYDTETEGLAYGQRELDIELKRNPGRDKQQDKIVEFGGVVAIRTINEDGTKTIDPTNLGFRNFYNPNLDRDKNKARVMDQIIVDIICIERNPRGNDLALEYLKTHGYQLIHQYKNNIDFIFKKEL